MAWIRRRWQGAGELSVSSFGPGETGTEWSKGSGWVPPWMARVWETLGPRLSRSALCTHIGGGLGSLSREVTSFYTAAFQVIHYKLVLQAKSESKESMSTADSLARRTLNVAMCWKDTESSWQMEDRVWNLNRHNEDLLRQITSLKDVLEAGWFRDLCPCHQGTSAMNTSPNTCDCHDCYQFMENPCLRLLP